MQVRRVWSRAARSLLAQRTRAVPVKAKTKTDGRTWRWRWSLGTEPNDAAVLEARQYLAADLDVEAVYLNTAYYSSTQGRRSGLWEPDEQAYDPHRLAKQHIVTTPSLGVEVKLAVSARWMDWAHRGRRLAVRLGSKTRTTAEPLARRGYQAARDRVTQAQAVKHLRRAPTAPDLSGTHTMQASLTFTPEPGMDAKLLTEQLIRAGVLRGAGVSAEDAPEPKVDGAETDLRFPLVRPQPTADPRRCVDPDNTVHLVHPFLALPLCGRPLKHEDRGKRGGRVFYTSDVELMPYDSRICEVCTRMSTALSEPPVDPELWRSASPVQWEENNRLFAEALGDRAHHAFKDAAAASGHPSGVDVGQSIRDALTSCPGCGRAYGADGVSCHRTPADGWVCEIAIKDHPLTRAGVSKMTVWKLSPLQQLLIDLLKKNGGRIQRDDLVGDMPFWWHGYRREDVLQALDYLLDEGLLLAPADDVYVLPMPPGSQTTALGRVLIDIVTKRGGSVPMNDLVAAAIMAGNYTPTSVWSVLGSLLRGGRLVAPGDGEIALPTPPPANEEADFEALRDWPRVVDREGVLHLTSEPFPASLTKVVPHCGKRLDIGPVKYFEALVKRGDPAPADAKSICIDCVETQQSEQVTESQEAAVDPEPVEAAQPDASPELDDGDEMPVLLVTFDAKVYLPKLMVRAGMVTSQKNGARLINSGQVTIDGKPCVGKLTFNPIELVGFVVELGGRNTTGSLRIYESMTRRFRVLMA